MKLLDLTEAVNILEAATIIQTIDAGHCIVHVGTDETGRKFVLINDNQGNTVISEGM